MAERKSPSCSRPEEGAGRPAHRQMEAWQRAWLNRHRRQLISRMSTMDIIDVLIEKGSIDTDQDAYQNIAACHYQQRNERARLPLDFLLSRSNTQDHFWDFQAALLETGLGDLAVKRDDEQRLAQIFDTDSRVASTENRELPASVVKVVDELKKRYRTFEVPSVHADDNCKPMSLDKLVVNISLLSADELDALCGCPAQKQPFSFGRLKDKASSAIELKDVFKKDERGFSVLRQLVSGGAGAGKSTAFVKKAPYEWAQEESDFWDHLTLLFEGSLNDPDWWKAKDLKEVFRLQQPRFGLSEEEQDDVVKFICRHSEEVLLVADSMDEASVDVDSFLWRVLTGKCDDLPNLSIIICSRPCEKTTWLSKKCVFHRRLEVIGFSDEKIDRFIQVYFSQDQQKASQLAAQLVDRPNVWLLMHTPLLCAMVCRLFQMGKRLPESHSEVCHNAVLAVLQQSTDRAGQEPPDSILERLSPPELHTAVENLAKLAFEGLTKKQVLFTKKQLEKTGCFEYGVNLGFLSLAPGIVPVRSSMDMYSFHHHTVLEFFAAVHAVKECQLKHQSMRNLVNKLGMDDDLSSFWRCVSGLPKGDECECLLSVLATMVMACAKKSGGHGELTFEGGRLFLLLLGCHAECIKELPAQGSAAVSTTISRCGLTFYEHYLSTLNAKALSYALHKYSSNVRALDLRLCRLDRNSLVDVLSSLRHCTRLRSLLMLGLELPVDVVTQSALADTIEKNSRTLLSLSLKLDSQGTMLLAPVIKGCTLLQAVGVEVRGGSHQVTAMLADILGHLNNLKALSISCDMDDLGCSSILPSVKRMAPRLTLLELEHSQLSIAAIISLLTGLTKLTSLTLCSTSLGEDGFRELIPCLLQLPALTRLLLNRAGLPFKCLVEIEKLFLSMPLLKECYVSTSKDSSQAISSFQSPTLQVTEILPTAESAHFLKAGSFVESKYFCLKNKRGQTILVYLDED